MKAVVQVRGEVDMNNDIQDTLEMLNIHAVNHCALVPETPTYEGMVTKVNDYVAHGQPSQESVETLLRTRAEPLEGDADVDDEWIDEHTEYDDITALANALVDEETTLRDEGLAPVLRLHAPRKGHEGVKKPTAEGGQLGKHTTEEIDDLLTSMR
ncbi:50S ribosomal protein L30 [Halostella sp. PRR32]|uniref:50S ribosomal protein L30 n=1 Tax=Halostella sp. PRR32 TaxID=3098147 RepID=UPI002B1E7528|nr:50S ribosomal protein L30 [Halostella sp. PRR32]